MLAVRGVVMWASFWRLTCRQKPAVLVMQGGPHARIHSLYARIHSLSHSLSEKEGDKSLSQADFYTSITNKISGPLGSLVSWRREQEWRQAAVMGGGGESRAAVRCREMVPVFVGSPTAAESPPHR